jgi:regulatory Fis family protein
MMKPNNPYLAALIACLEDSASDITPSVTFRAARRQFEREYVTAVLERYQWQISEAARMLGMQRSNLYRTIRRLHVSRSSTQIAGGVSSSKVIVDGGMPRGRSYDISVADRRRNRRLRRRIAIEGGFTSDTE